MLEYKTNIDLCLDVISGKWKIQIILSLYNQTRRTHELKKELTGISQRVLIQQLAELLEDQIISRKSYNKVPPHVEYRLTSHGKKLIPIIKKLADWGNLHISKLGNSEIQKMTTEEFNQLVKEDKQGIIKYGKRINGSKH